jgi:hypothetical protein
LRRCPLTNSPRKGTSKAQKGGANAPRITCAPVLHLETPAPVAVLQQVKKFTFSLKIKAFCNTFALIFNFKKKFFA